MQQETRQGVPATANSEHLITPLDSLVSKSIPFWSVLVRYPLIAASLVALQAFISGQPLAPVFIAVRH